MTRTCTLLALGTTMLVAAACNDHAASRELTAPIFDRKENAKNGNEEHERRLGASLKGRNEVPPRETRATGTAFFRLSKDGNSVDYKLIVHDIKNPFMAHIHIGAAGVNGPIVVWLFPSTEPTPGPLGVGRRDGQLAKGTFTAANFLNIPPELIQHCGVCQCDGLSEWMGGFASQFQRLFGPCASLIRVALLPLKMGRPATGKLSQVGAEASNE